MPFPDINYIDFFSKKADVKSKKILKKLSRGVTAWFCLESCRSRFVSVLF